MDTLLKLANKIENQLRKLAVQNIMQQLNELVSAAFATFELRGEIQKHVNSGDMYGKMNSDSVLKLVDSMYFAASGMKQDVLKKGINKADMESRKNRIISLCDQASQFLASNGVPTATIGSLGFNLVRAKAEAIVPVTLPALQPDPKPEVTPEETGVAYNMEEEAQGATPEELDEALNLIRPKSEQSGLVEMPLRAVPRDAY